MAAEDVRVEIDGAGAGQGGHASGISQTLEMRSSARMKTATTGEDSRRADDGEDGTLSPSSGATPAPPAAEEFDAAASAQYEEAIRLSSARNWAEAARAISALPAALGSQALRGLSSLERMSVFVAIERPTAELFLALGPSEMSVLVEDMRDDVLQPIFNALSSETRVHLLERLSQGAVSRMTPILEASELELVRPLFGYPQNCVGRVMHVLSSVSLVPDSATVGEALALLRVSREDTRFSRADVIYVVDRHRKLRGELSYARLMALLQDRARADSLTFDDEVGARAAASDKTGARTRRVRSTSADAVTGSTGDAGDGVGADERERLLSAEGAGAVSSSSSSSSSSMLSRPVSRYMTPALATVSTHTPIHDFVLAMRHPQHSFLSCVPVLEEDGVLAGVVTMHEAFRQARLQGERSSQMLAAMEGDSISYSKLGAWGLVRKRVVWLLVLILLNLGSSGILRAFEHTLAANVSLTYFVPLLVAMGGNTGAQVVTLLIAALSSRDIALTDLAPVFCKELGVGLLLSLPMTVITFGVALIVTGGLVGVSVVVSITMALVVNLSNMMGATMPFFFSKVGIDPSVVCGPILTSLIDVGGLALYLGIAVTIL